MATAKDIALKGGKKGGPENRQDGNRGGSGTERARLFFYSSYHNRHHGTNSGFFHNCKAAPLLPGIST